MRNPFDELRLYPSASALVDYWLELRKPGETCPYKSDFSPMHLGKVLPDVFLTEWLDANNILIRVAGSNTSDVMQQDVTGKNLLDVVPAEHRSAIGDFHKKMQNDLCAVATVYEMAGHLTPKIARTLHLPLLDDDGSVSFFVGVTKAHSKERNNANIRTMLSSSKTSMSVKIINLNVSNAPTVTKII